MSEPASISSGIAERYATAVFELASEDKALDAVETDIDALSDALEASDALRDVIASPVYSRTDQERAMAALAGRMGLSRTVANTLALMARKRRLFALPQLLAVLRRRIAEARGEITAEVTAAKALTKAQAEELSKVIKASVGKDVKLRTTVDDSLIGGLVVEVGSKMIDTSIRSRLAALRNTMKEVG